MLLWITDCLQYNILLYINSVLRTDSSTTPTTATSKDDRPTDIYKNKFSICLCKMWSICFMEANQVFLQTHTEKSANPIYTGMVETQRGRAASTTCRQTSQNLFCV